MESNAFFSPCGKFRWKLTRLISKSPKELIFVGLNPSKADAITNDLTLIRLISFCTLWGYGSLTVINLFGKITKDPRQLLSNEDPIGSQNDSVLNKNIYYWSKAQMCDLWIGWGTKGIIMNRNKKVLSQIKKSCSKKPLIIGLTKAGHPRHPLYTSKEKYLYPFPI